MRLLRFLTAGVTLASYALAQDLTPEVSAEKHQYQVRYHPRCCGFGHKFISA